MTNSTVFTNKRSQAVCFLDSVKKVNIRVSEVECIIAPTESAWDSFF